MTLCCAAAAEAAEKLKSELETARQEAEDRKVAAEKANADLEALKKTNQRFESRVSEVENLLQEASTKCEALEGEKKKQDLLVTQLTKSTKEARTNARRYQQELEMVESITAGKPYLL
jgi:chromosome segregation ATPase